MRVPTDQGQIYVLEKAVLLNISEGRLLHRDGVRYSLMNLSVEEIQCLPPSYNRFVTNLFIKDFSMLPIDLYYSFYRYSKMEDPATARLKSLVVCSNDALEFKMVRSVDDLENDEVTFRPEMSHQVFGDRFVTERRLIRIYNPLTVIVTYMSHSFVLVSDYSFRVSVNPYSVTEISE